MLSYSRAQGGFAGVSSPEPLSDLIPGANEKVYGKKISGEQIFSSVAKFNRPLQQN